ncbi:hypothetical protein JHK87_019795 [Glycine soja]|nr:hypothetical protein JHK87_019795 [Glycine soja]
MALLCRNRFIQEKISGYCKCWNICHHLLGYGIIGIVIANSFAGFHAETLKRVYVAILGVLAVVVVPLEIYRCKSQIMHHAVIIHRELWNRSRRKLMKLC